jgi:hypothetical protein
MHSKIADGNDSKANFRRSDRVVRACKQYDHRKARALTGREIQELLYYPYTSFDIVPKISVIG